MARTKSSTPSASSQPRTEPAAVDSASTTSTVATSRLRSGNQAWLEIPRTDKISEKIARSILHDIVVRQLPVGSTLPAEAIMLERYGVGRGSLREALRILEIHGLIKIKSGPRGGPVVAQVTSSDLARSATFFFHAIGATFGDLLRARLVIEPLMARLAAEQLTPESAEALQSSLEESEETGNAWPRQSAGFHVVVNGLSGNPVLDLLCRSLLDIYAERIRPEFPVSERKAVRHAHDKITEAILAKDADTAESRMRRHVQSQLAEMEQNRPEVMDELIDWR